DKLIRRRILGIIHAPRPIGILYRVLSTKGAENENSLYLDSSATVGTQDSGSIDHGNRRLPPAVGATDSLPGLTSAQLADFNAGLADFTSVETIADGLGPVFNGKSCAEWQSPAR